MRGRRWLWKATGLAILLIGIWGLLADHLHLKLVHQKVRDLNDIQNRKNLLKIYDFLQQATSASDEKERLAAISSAEAFLSEQLGFQAERMTCGEDVPRDQQVVCPEAFGGSKVAQMSSCFNTSWHLDTKNCRPEAVSPDWGSLLTVIVYPSESMSASEVRERLVLSSAYGAARIVIASAEGRGEVQKTDGVEVVEVEKGEAESVTWTRLVAEVGTPFVLVGWDLHSLSPMANLERSVRLLHGDPLVAAVAGASRNRTGHWRAPCYQADTVNYELSLEPGYRESACDCMHCAVVEGAPFVTSTELFSKIPLQTSSGEMGAQAMFLSWFLDVKESGFETLLCPDILYLTYTGEWPQLPRDQWLVLAKEQQVHAVVTDHRPRLDHVFTCDEISLECSPREQQSDAVILPWCCFASYVHVLRQLDRVTERFDVHYELDAGSCLGAVKIGHLIPWDIDGDVYISTEKIDLFAPGGPAKKAMEEAGITVYAHNVNNYGDKGAGYFMLWHKGLEVEMLGRRGQLTRTCHPELGGVSTRVLVGDVWLKTHANPGAYSRTRYGPGYLRHAQSWRYADSMKDSFGRYESGGRWRFCPDPSNHACLEKYPTDGNTIFHPEAFTAWKNEEKRREE